LRASVKQPAAENCILPGCGGVIARRRQNGWTSPVI
jgi:hypothetical protein